MLPTLQETLRNFVADTMGETPQEQYLRPRCNLNHQTNIPEQHPRRLLALAHHGTAGFK